ncbi:hypothetical protein ECXG_01973 [Escherichia coli TA447]|uniref:Uncharacterized protein n=1 Tax=Escherichia coli TA447 TaxID=656447 RepID=A0A1X3J3R0_ECOLX|nr:hypothetical protein ECXG_01973 [Escherichia coli TA447]
MIFTMIYYFWLRFLFLLCVTFLMRILLRFIVI